MSGYNERLFSGGIRSKLHLARFKWVEKKVSELRVFPLRVVELGCFDGRLVDVLKPSAYAGFDADWEGGLSAARKRFRDKEIVFHKCVNPSELFAAIRDVNLFVSLETFEHIPPEMIEEYIERSSNLGAEHGLVTVPNEKGLIFFLKYFAKRLFFGGGQRYRAKEFLAATLGNMKHVQRHEHKGFDYEQLENQLAKYWQIQSIEGIQWPWLPIFLNFQVGFVLRRKR